MATVAFPVGPSPTVPMDWSRWKAHPITMMVVRVHERVAAWVQLESRIDAWASYAALGLAAAGAVLALVAMGSF